MWWTLAFCLLMAGFQLSSQDWVTTTAPQTDVLEASELQAQVGNSRPSILSLHIMSNIMYRYATTVVTSRVVNPKNESGEAVFTITLPESAFISNFVMEISGKAYKALIEDKEKAKAIYGESVEAGHVAGHVAQHARDSNQFTVSVNVQAFGKVTFNLTYEQLLSRNDGMYTHVINIDPQQVVPDMTVTVNIEEPTEVKDLEVPEVRMITNDALEEKFQENALAVVEEKNANHKVVVWAPTPEQQKALSSTGVSGQFIVRYDVDRSQNPQQILVDEGYFVHFFAPQYLPLLKKHVVFVLDYSGSMEGTKLEQLKDAMDQILSDLSDKDHFSIVVFQSYVQVWSPLQRHVTSTEDLSSWSLKEVPETYFNTILDQQFVLKASPKNLAAAKSHLRNFSDLGGTNIMSGLRTGLSLTSIGSDMWINESDPPQPLMVFLTDGQPNVGESDTKVIIDNTKLLNTLKCPIFSLAFGYDADLPFLRQLSLSNSGFARTIYEAADAAEQLGDFYSSIASPLVSNVTFNYLPGQVDDSSYTKTDFPVYYNGSELVVSGKFNKGRICAHEESTKIGDMTGVTGNGIQTFPIVVDCTKQPLLNRSSGSRLEKTWAQLKIQQLLDEADSIDNGDEKDKIKEKASNLALQYSFVTPLTSMVVFKPNNESDVVDPIKIQPEVEESGETIPVVKVTTTSTPPPTTTTTTTTAPSTTTLRPLGKVAISEVKWLRPFIRNLPLAPRNINISIPFMGIYAVLGLNEPDKSVGKCEVNGEPGECRHLKYCALNIFRDDVTKFQPWHCSVYKGFLRVCCPYAAS